MQFPNDALKSAIASNLDALTTVILARGACAPTGIGCMVHEIHPVMIVTARAYGWSEGVPVFRLSKGARAMLAAEDAVARRWVERRSRARRRLFFIAGEGGWLLNWSAATGFDVEEGSAVYQ